MSWLVAISSGTGWRLCVSGVAVAALLLALAWTTAQAPPAAARPSAHCGAFKGKRLLHGRSVVVITRDEEERREYAFVCVPPSGRVYLAGWAFDETVEALYSLKVLASAGSWVALQFGSQVDFHGGEEVAKMCNARTGRCYRFFQANTYDGQEFQEVAAEQPGLDGVLVNRLGQTLLAETQKGTTRVIGIGSSGSKRLLDSAPEASIAPSSLKLMGPDASWIDAGTVRRASL